MPTPSGSLSCLFGVVWFLIAVSSPSIATNPNLCVDVLEDSQRVASVSVYSCLQFRVDGNATQYQNPFNFSEILVQGHFSQNDSVVSTMDGFFYQNYTRSITEKAAHLTPVGVPHWLVRFTPTVPGLYGYRLTLADAAGTRTVASGEFSVTAVSACDDGTMDCGFIQVSPVTHTSETNSTVTQSRYFEYRGSHTPYFAVGDNVCWPGESWTYDYDTWFAHMGSVGATYARLWIGVIGFDIENKESGVGHYDLGRLWRLDYVVALAQKYNIRLMLTLDSFNSLRRVPNWPAWDINPYNVANGGMLAHPLEFWTNEEARAAYWQRLRYVVSRYAAVPSVLSWEFWNEVDLTEGYEPSLVKAWHKAAAQYIRSVDSTYQHMRTTSFSLPFGTPTIYSLPELDYIQTHKYDSSDFADAVSQWDWLKATAHNKPHYLGECGISQPELPQDPKGVALHNGLWAAVVSTGAGTAMSWWWDMYVDPMKLYTHFGPVASFARRIPWISKVWENITLISVNATAYARPRASSLAHLRVVTDAEPLLRVLGQSGNDDMVLLWAQDSRNTWKKPSPQLIGETKIQVQTAIHGGALPCEASCFDTYPSGTREEGHDLAAPKNCHFDNGVLSLTLPTLYPETPDIICTVDIAGSRV